MFDLSLARVLSLGFSIKQRCGAKFDFWHQKNVFLCNQRTVHRGQQTRVSSRLSCDCGELTIDQKLSHLNLKKAQVRFQFARRSDSHEGQ